MPQHTPGIPAGGRAVSSTLTAPCIWLHGDAAAVMNVRRILYASGLLNSPLRLRLAETAGVARLAICALRDGYELHWRPETGSTWIAMYTGQDFNEVLKYVQQAARWHTLSRLEHSWSVQEPGANLAFELWSLQSIAGTFQFQPRWSLHTSTKDTIYLENAELPENWPRPICEIRIANLRSDGQPIYLALYMLAENYTISSLFNSPCRCLEPGASTRVRLAGNLPGEFAAVGLTQTSTLVKLLVSNRAFNAEQIGNPLGSGTREKVLGGRVRERTAEMPDNWFASQLRVLTETTVPQKQNLV